MLYYNYLIKQSFYHPLEYKVSMFDGNMGRKKWNVTFYDYSAREADEAYGKKSYYLQKSSFLAKTRSKSIIRT